MLLSMILLAQPVDPLAPLPTAPQAIVLPPPATTRPLPATTAVPLVVPRDWRAEFAAIRAGNWLSANAGIAALPNDLIKPVARAELYLARGSPVVPLQDLEALLSQAPELAQADQIGRLAANRGAVVQTAIAERAVIGLGAAPQRRRARPVTGDAMADALRAQLDPLLKADQAEAAEALLAANALSLTPEGRAEASQRVAWSYYGLGRDADVIRLAESGRVGASGDWATAASWVSGLASWRQGDCATAGLRFDEVIAGATGELAAAASYWAARTAQACRRPAKVASLLKAAAISTESFYGLIARETLGMPTRVAPSGDASTGAVDSLPNVRRARLLAAIGERGLAEQALRHQARIGDPSDQPALITVARQLELPGAQYWLATNGRPGARAASDLRYPRPAWRPRDGWRVDPALAFGHILQESSFRVAAVSAAGAIGPMQVRPGTAGDFARVRGVAFDPATLADPAVNLDYGQSFIELLRTNAATRGQLPRVIAAYNAGPVPVDRWNAIPDKGDPLLWIESIPYWETRFYVPAVMRNMWVYQGLDGAAQPSLKAMAQHKWPAFPAR